MIPIRNIPFPIASPHGILNPLMPDREHTIAELVRLRRRTSGITQRELAELAGVGVRFISELERGKATLRMDTTNAVLAVFGLELGAVALSRDEVVG